MIATIIFNSTFHFHFDRLKITCMENEIRKAMVELLLPAPIPASTVFPALRAVSSSGRGACDSTDA